MVSGDNRSPVEPLANDGHAGVPLCFRNEPEEAPLMLYVTLPLRAAGFVKQTPTFVIPSESGPIAMIFSSLPTPNDEPVIKLLPNE